VEKKKSFWTQNQEGGEKGEGSLRKGRGGLVLATCRKEGESEPIAMQGYSVYLERGGKKKIRRPSGKTRRVGPRKKQIPKLCNIGGEGVWVIAITVSCADSSVARGKRRR